MRGQFGLKQRSGVEGFLTEFDNLQLSSFVHVAHTFFTLIGDVSLVCITVMPEFELNIFFFICSLNYKCIIDIPNDLFSRNGD